MKKRLIPVFFVCTFFILQAQQFVLVSVGEGYGYQSYYNLADDRETQISNEAWDLAFAMNGTGIHLNESSKSTFLEPSKELRLFHALGTRFEEPVNPDHLRPRLWNDEKSWAWGALNNDRQLNDPNDVGWGVFTSPDEVTGHRIFVLQQREGDFIKFTVENFLRIGDFARYVLRYAKLDGSNEKRVTIAWPGGSDHPFLKYFSFKTGGEVIGIPPKWDLVFQRHVTPLDDGQGGILDYTVTGVLVHEGMEVAKASNVNPQLVDLHDYRDSFSSRTDRIGYDWKSFDFSNSNEWKVYTDRAYFIKDQDGVIWKIVFVDFEGSATGNIVFQKWKIGTLSATGNPTASQSDFIIFPNPATDEFQILIDHRGLRETLVCSIRDLSGREVWRGSSRLEQGWQAIRWQGLHLPEGIYLLTIVRGHQAITQKLIIQY